LRTRVPRYSRFEPASAASSRAMRGNRATDTRPETVLRRVLWTMGARYRKNVIDLPGKPDLVFARARLVVFCDGDFWHGRDWGSLQRRLQSRANAAYWVKKIQANRERDRRTTARLRRAGWRVMRVWEGEVLKNPSAVAADIIAACKDSSSDAYRPCGGSRRPDLQ
jgi:DNA mismatch endonuclease (patch repair protein)